MTRHEYRPVEEYKKETDFSISFKGDILITAAYCAEPPADRVCRILQP